MSNLIKIYLFFLPFQSVILYSNDSIEINLPTLVGTILTPFFVISNKYVLPKSFKYLIFLIFWFFITNFIRFGLDTYVLSIFQLLTAIIPSISIFSNIKNSNLKKTLIIILKFQLLFFIPFIFRDFGVFNFDILDFIFQEVQYSTRSDYFGISRSRAIFNEPSYFGIYLTLIYFLFKNLKLNIFWRLLLLIEILTTFSFGCFVLIFLIHIYIFLKKISFKIILSTLFIIIIFSLIINKTDYGNKIYSVIEERVSISFNAIALGVLTGSEGSRINSLPVAFMFANENTNNFILGEGFSRDRNWLKRNFGHIPLNQLGEGYIFNTFAAVVFHGGITALILYLLFLIKLFKNIKISSEFVLIFLYLHFVYSGLQSYYLWICIFLVINIVTPSLNQSKKNDKNFIKNRFIN